MILIEESSVYRSHISSARFESFDFPERDHATQMQLRGRKISWNRAFRDHASASKFHRRGSWKAESAQKIKNAFIAYSSSTSNSIHSEKNPGQKYWFLTQLFKVKDVDQGWSKATTAKIVNGQRSNVDQNSQPLMVIPSNIPTNIHTMGVCWVNAHPSYLWPALSPHLEN